MLHLQRLTQRTTAHNSAACCWTSTARSLCSRTPIPNNHKLRQHWLHLFTACDVNANGVVTLDELSRTLFRFGLDGISPDELDAIFMRAATKKDRHMHADMTAHYCETFESHVDDAQVAALGFDDFVRFVEEAIQHQKNSAAAAAGSSPSWVQWVAVETAHFKTGFSLLRHQTKSAAALVMHHGGSWRTLSKRKRLLVAVAVRDFAKCLPFACLACSPGATLLVPLLAKSFPNALPTTFHDTSADPDHLISQNNLAVASRILTLEQELRKAKQLRDQEENKDPGG